MWFKFGLILFAIYTIVNTFNQYHAKKVPKSWVITYALIWLVGIGVAVIPDWFDRLAQAVGVERGADLLVYLAVLGLLYINYRLMIRTRTLEQEITAIVREIAIAEGQWDEGKYGRN